MSTKELAIEAVLREVYQPVVDRDGIEQTRLAYHGWNGGVIGAHLPSGQAGISFIENPSDEPKAMIAALEVAIGKAVAAATYRYERMR